MDPGTRRGGVTRRCRSGSAIYVRDRRDAAIPGAGGLAAWRRDRAGTGYSLLEQIDYTAGPIAGDGRVFASLTWGGNGPARCFLAAHDAATGKQLWKRETVAGPNDSPAAALLANATCCSCIPR
jgi:hypothetical protein